MQKLWSVEEANQVLPHLREILSVLIEQKKRAELAEEALSELEARAKGNGHGLGAEMAHRKARVRAATDQIRQALEQVRGLGCEVKDLDSGLVDFPSEREGRPVLLCWSINEPAVLYYHDQDQGYSGRQPL